MPTDPTRDWQLWHLFHYTFLCIPKSKNPAWPLIYCTMCNAKTYCECEVAINFRSCDLLLLRCVNKYLVLNNNKYTEVNNINKTNSASLRRNNICDLCLERLSQLIFTGISKIFSIRLSMEIKFTRIRFQKS